VTIDGRPALRFERNLGHSAERVWRAITEPAEMAQWFVAPVAWIPEEGEEFDAAGAHGRITDVKPPRLLAWSWGVERYSFELTPGADGNSCVLVFTHVFNPELGPGWQHAAGWDTYFNRLDVHLDGGFLSEEDAHQGVQQLMAEYRQDFEGATAEQ
jgi:uncharacterized protein YndB with AHSA1/START domain